MRALRRLAGLGLAVPLVVLSAGAAASAPVRSTTARRVLVVAYPSLTWNAVRDARVPVLQQLLGRGALGSLSVRATGHSTSAAQAYATIGAGSRATADEATAGFALERDEPLEGGTAVGAWQRRCACADQGAPIVAEAMPALRLRNNGLHYGTIPGSLGSTLAAAGRRVAVIGNADGVVSALDPILHREAALALADEDGRVVDGAVGDALLQRDPAAPYGQRLAPDATAAAVDAAWRRDDVVLLEMSDLARATRYGSFTSPAAAQALWSRAMADSDLLLGRVLRHVDLRRDLVLVIGPTSPAGEPQLTVAGAIGPGFGSGSLRSATTRRAGFVTLPDLAPTILAALGVPTPTTMAGTPIRAVGRSPSLAALARTNDLAMRNNRMVRTVATIFIVLVIVVLAAAAAAWTWGSAAARRTAAAAAVLLLAAVPVTFLLGLSPLARLGAPACFGALLLGIVAVAWLAMGLQRRSGRRITAPVAVVALSAAVLLADVLSGSRLQLSTPFGYSPTVAGRFAGLGNLAFAALAASALLLAGWMAASGTRVGRGRPLALALLVVAVLADGLPQLGSDVGGVLALVPAAAVFALVLAARRVGLWRLGTIAGGTVAVLGLFTAIDLSRPAASRTHLGRLASRLLNGSTGFTTVLERKLSANVAIFTSSTWTWLLLPAALFGIFLWWGPGQPLRARLESDLGLRAGVAGALVAGVVGAALNDSGVAVLAMVLAIVLPFLAWVVLDAPAGRASPAEAEGARASG